MSEQKPLKDYGAQPMFRDDAQTREVYDESGRRARLAISGERRVGQGIRSCCPYQYRSSQWGIVDSIVNRRGPCYSVYWPDGDSDLWPIDDSLANYEFREA